jgi:hypothetical protein
MYVMEWQRYENEVGPEGEREREKRERERER